MAMDAYSPLMSPACSARVNSALHDAGVDAEGGLLSPLASEGAGDHASPELLSPVASIRADGNSRFNSEVRDVADQALKDSQRSRGCAPWSKHGMFRHASDGSLGPKCMGSRTSVEANGRSSSVYRRQEEPFSPTSSFGKHSEVNRRSSDAIDRHNSISRHSSWRRESKEVTDPNSPAPRRRSFFRQSDDGASLGSSSLIGSVPPVVDLNVVPPKSEAPRLPGELPNEPPRETASTTMPCDSRELRGAGSGDKSPAAHIDDMEVTADASGSRPVLAPARSTLLVANFTNTGSSARPGVPLRHRSRNSWWAPLAVAKKLGLAGALEWLIEWVDLEIERAAISRGWQIMHSTGFQIMVSSLILLQAFFVGYGANNALDVEMDGAERAMWMDHLEDGFKCFFCMELVARALVERIGFLLGPEWRWNLFDSLLVALSMAEISSGRFGGAIAGRILRVSRFVFLMRISRVMRKLPSLRLILLAILDSMASLVWCFVFIAFIMYVFAVLIVYGAADCFENQSSACMDEQVASDMKSWWGGIYRSMVTLFMAISGGVDWSVSMDPLRHMNSAYELLFLAYIFFMCFGVLNVVVGAFVATAHQLAAKDREALVKYTVNELEAYSKRIKGFFHEADIDRSGTLSWEEFKQHLEDPKVQAYFQALELDVSQAHILFDLLDTDDSDSVTIDEFVDGCIRLRGQARSIDLNMLVYMSQKMFEQLSCFVDGQDKILELLHTVPREASVATMR